MRIRIRIRRFTCGTWSPLRYCVVKRRELMCLRRKGVFLLLVLFWVVATAVWLWRSDKESEDFRAATTDQRRLLIETTPSPCERFSVRETRKYILIWNMPFEDPAMVPENLFIGHMPSNLFSIAWNTEECGNCKLTYDRRMINKSDALVFHVSPKASTYIPPKGQRDQKYVWWSQESRSNENYNDSRAEYYDWTMSPSRTSDVFSPYATFPWILKFLWRKERGSDIMAKLGEVKGEYMADKEDLDYLLKGIFGDLKTSRRLRSQNLTQKLLQKKQKLAIWVSSNCRTRSSLTRLDVVDKIEACGMKIDKFGQCNYERLHLSRWDPSYFEVLSRYKFYFSFENSVHCRDYITEKLWFNALYSGAVPVIWGPHRDDVKAVLPPMSYIHVEDFSSIANLVKYLKYLDRNDAAYAKYLEWRTWIRYLDKNGEYHPENLRKIQRTIRPSLRTALRLQKYATMKPVGFCQFCRKLHTPPDCLEAPNTDFGAEEREECLDEDLAEDIAQKLGVYVTSKENMNENW